MRQRKTNNNNNKQKKPPQTNKQQNKTKHIALLVCLGSQLQGAELFGLSKFIDTFKALFG